MLHTESRQRLKLRRRLHRALNKLRDVTPERYASERTYHRVLTQRTNTVRRTENELAAAVVAERCEPELANAVRAALRLIG